MVLEATLHHNGASMFGGRNGYSKAPGSLHSLSSLLGAPGDGSGSMGTV